MGRIVVAAGGTAGHLKPAQALALTLQESGHDLLFMAPLLKRSPYFDKEAFPFVEIFGKKRFSSTLGVFQALYHMIKNRPVCVVGFGSYHAFPACIAAILLRLPLILFEPNVVPGKVNQLLAPFARLNTSVLGASRRVAMPGEVGSCDKKVAYEYYGLSPAKKTVLIFGGSQGSLALNRHAPQALGALDTFQVIHITGRGKACSGIMADYDKQGIRAVVKEYEENMIYAWSIADLSISRAGASTIVEQIRHGVPGILIPYPHASNHQEYNAQFLQDEVQGGMMLREKNIAQLKNLLALAQKQLPQMQKKLDEYTLKSDDLASLVEEVL